MTDMRTGTLAIAMAWAIVPRLAYGYDASGDRASYALDDPVFAQAVHEQAAAREEVGQALAQRFPRVDARVSFTHKTSVVGAGLHRWATTDVSRDAQSFDPGFTRKRSLALSLTLPVIDMPAHYEIQAARANARVAEARMAAARRDLLFRRMLAEVMVYRDRERLMLAEESARAWLALTDLARLRLEVGLSPVTDVAEAISQSAAATTAVIEAKRQWEDSLVQYRLLSGGPSPPDKSHPSLMTALVRPHHRPAAALIEDALRHPLLVGAGHEVLASGYRFSAARAAHLPTLRFEASYGVATVWTDRAGRSGAGIRHNGRPIVSMMLTLNVPLIAGTAVMSRVQQEAARRSAKEDALETARRDMVRKVRTASRKANDGSRLLESARSAVLAAEAARDAVVRGFSAGTRSWADRLGAERRLIDARLADARSRADLAENNLRLGAMVGDLDTIAMGEI
ncbi:TolC family protein [Luteibacter aegosomaticola]|uniref:TolC family protein n=1 Tax=Luteibacter aegosomaticola TaxID=2911538 RepID=UPI001FF8669C|nr:TolC family protein [Luteibacter aegosomaticola]UPG88754.1 TolC family protein [Luteibacter aegosomaticola]